MNIWDRQLQEIKDIRAQNRKYYAEILRLREALKYILTHCESDTPPNAEALILFVNKTLEEGND